MSSARVVISSTRTRVQVVAGGRIETGGVSDGDKGDVTVSAFGATWTVDAVGGATAAAVAAHVAVSHEAAGTAAALMTIHVAAGDPHPGYALEASLGGAASLNVGVTAGTVAAGDHLHAATYQPLDADLTALAALATTGLVSRTAANTYVPRTLAASGAGLTVSNGDGVSGSPTIALADDVAAVEALSGTGLVRRTGSATWTTGTVVSIAEGGTGATTRVAAVAALGRTWGSVTPGTTTDATTGTAFWSATLAVGTYNIRGAVIVASVLGSTALNTRATATSGLVATAAQTSFAWSTHLAATQNAGSTDMEAWTAFTAGTGTNKLMAINGRIVVTTGGVLVFEFRSEVAAATVEIVGGEISTEQIG